jgi:formylglycine-generating enzyme required for sulfatase activity
MGIVTALGLTFVVASATPACDPQPQGCFGLESSAFLIQQTEVTNAEYVEFLNAVAAVDDPAGLWNPNMADPSQCYSPGGFIDVCGGIERAGAPGAWTYASIAGRAQHPVNVVSWYDMLRFANWLHNGRPTGPQGPGTTEDGAYEFMGPTTVGPRQPGAQAFVPTEDEWYAAAYWNPTSALWDYAPAGNHLTTSGSLPSSTPGTANCEEAVDALTDAGSYPNSVSGAGALDMAGNVYELMDGPADPGYVRARGGSWGKFCLLSYADRRTELPQSSEVLSYGFRVAASLPEPSTGIMFCAGLAALAALGRRRR